MSDAPGTLRQVLEMTWLWNIFAGFYLVAYAFWVPRLFSSTVIVIAFILVTLALGGGLLLDGFGAALELQTGQHAPAIPFVRARRLLGGVVLLSYTAVYIPSDGRIVAHWPLDLAITVLSGVVVVYYGATKGGTPSQT